MIVSEGPQPPKSPVERALSLLIALESLDLRATLAELARATGMSPPTTLRLLRVLERTSFVQRGDDRTYRMGPQLIRLGALALRELPLHDLAHPHLVQLVEETGESAGLGIRSQDQVLYIDQVPSTRSIRHVNWTGHTVPLDGTAIGAAMQGRVGPDGYAVTRQTLEPDITAVAVPIRGADNQIVGALNVTGPTYRISDGQIAEIGKLLRDHANALSETLGSRREDRAG